MHLLTARGLNLSPALAVHSIHGSLTGLPNLNSSLTLLSSTRTNLQKQKFERSSFNGDRFGQVPWTVDVAAAQNRYVIGEELERDDGQDSLQAVDCVRNLDRLEGHRLRFLVILLAYYDWPSISSDNLVLVGICYKPWG